MFPKNPLRLLAVPSLLLISSAVANAADITFTDLYNLGGPAGSNLVLESGAARGGQVVGSSASPSHAFLWTSSGLIDLHPAVGFSQSRAIETSGTQQVGNGSFGTSNHALLWSGSAASVVDLTPAGFTIASAEGIDGNQQVGSAQATPSTFPHAMLWTGTAASAVDLNPAGYIGSTANGAEGGQQVGNANPGGGSHAALWNGTADSFVDLNPAVSIFNGTTAEGNGDGQQVGSGSFPMTLRTHALLWTGSAASMVDLNPDGYDSSRALDAGSGYQVGFGRLTSGGFPHALLWDDTAASVIDLQALIPGTVTLSYATSIIGDTIYGVADGHAVIWTLPEPASLSLLTLCAIPMLRNRRRR